MAMMEVGQAFQHIAFRSSNGLFSETHQYNTLTIMEQYIFTERITLLQDFLYHLTTHMREYFKTLYLEWLALPKSFH
jgi:hypothetical protein